MGAPPGPAGMPGAPPLGGLNGAPAAGPRRDLREPCRAVLDCPGQSPCATRVPLPANADLRIGFKEIGRAMNAAES